MRTRTRLIALTATVSVAALAATPLAGAAVPSGGGGIAGTVGTAGGGAPSGGGGGHFSGGGGAVGGGFRGGSFAAGGGFRGGGGGFRGGGGSRFGGVGFAPHGFYAPARGYGMIGSRSAGLGAMVVMRGGREAGNFAAIGPRFGSAASASRIAPHFASAARAVLIARAPRVTLRVPAVRPGTRPPPIQRPAPKMQQLNLPSRVGASPCEVDSCRQVLFQPFCIDLTAQELADPHFVRAPFDCPQPVRARMR
jgi:hypothetical protein